MKKILVFIGILFTFSLLNADVATRCWFEPNTTTIGYPGTGSVVETGDGGTMRCYSQEVVPGATKTNKYSQSICDNKYPGSEYHMNDFCYCPSKDNTYSLRDYDYTLRKCIDRDATCNQKYPGTKYQADGDKCVCSNGGQYDSNRKSCEEPEYVEPEGTECIYSNGAQTETDDLELIFNNRECQPDGTWGCTSGYIWKNNACSLDTISGSGDGISYSVIKTPFDAATYLSGLGIITERNTPSEYMVQSLVLRQELIGIALKLKKITLSENYTCQNIFSDISQSKPNEWVCRAAETALMNGIITKNKFFNPRSNVTISEALAMVFSALELPEKPYDGKTNYFYPGIEQWQKSVLISSRNYGMIDSTNIDPNLPVNRGAVFLMIAKALGW